MGSPETRALHRSVRVAGPADVDFIVATERLPGYEALVARWSEREHHEALARPAVAYLVLESPTGSPAGFAILEGLDDRHEGVKLKRIAVSEPGLGHGLAFVQAIIEWVFTQTGAARLWLDVFDYNARARHVYRRAGLSEDGLLRQAYVLPSGERVDRVLMSILRGEWERR